MSVTILRTKAARARVIHEGLHMAGPVRVSITADDLDALLDAAERLARVEAVHAQYFDMDGRPGYDDDTNPEPEDVWRYDRDFRAALNPEASA